MLNLDDAISSGRMRAGKHQIREEHEQAAIRARKNPRNAQQTKVDSMCSLAVDKNRK